MKENLKATEPMIEGYFTLIIEIALRESSAMVDGGRGRYNRRNGDWWEGEWKNGKLNGKGAIHFATGDVYEGDLRGNLREGRRTSSTVQVEIAMKKRSGMANVREEGQTLPMEL